MALKRALPRICIALGFPDLPKLLENAKREAESGETFLEFRLDYLHKPEQGAEAIGEFLRQFPECTVLATCRRQPNHGHFSGSIEAQFRVLDLAWPTGRRQWMWRLKRPKWPLDRTAAFRDHAQLLISYHNFETTPQIETIMKRLTRVSADAYKVVTTARKPSDTGRVLAAAKRGGTCAGDLARHGRNRNAEPCAFASIWGLFTYAAPILRKEQRRAAQCSSAAASIPCR